MAYFCQFVESAFQLHLILSGSGDGYRRFVISSNDMCTVFVAIDAHDDYPMIMMSNRDEFLDRPALPMDWWSIGILAGKDQQAGGTWLAINKHKDFSLVTNYRSPEHMKSKAKSRGELPIRALKEDQFLEQLKEEESEYSGFNLLLYRSGDLSYAANGPGYISKELSSGIHGLSNALINDPWPKVEKGKAWLTDQLQTDTFSIDSALEFLADTHIAPDEKLPETGVGIEWERKLSALNIRTEHYGTRVSTVLLLNANGQMEVKELNRLNGEERYFCF